MTKPSLKKRTDQLNKRKVAAVALIEKMVTKGSKKRAKEHRPEDNLAGFLALGAAMMSWAVWSGYDIEYINSTCSILYEDTLQLAVKLANKGKL